LWAKDKILARGHVNVKATHKSTLEITKEDYLTPRGDCIVGISADKGLADLSNAVKELIRSGGYVYLILEANGLREVISGRGSPELELSDPNRIIVRRSNYVSPNTLMIRSDKAARDINRNLVKSLRNGETLVAYVIASDSPLEHEEILRILVDP